jgi:predicted nucleotide-binding protein
LNNPWTPDLATYVVEMTGASELCQVLLIHGHAQDRTELRAWLENMALVNPIVMAQEFTAGQTLPEKFEILADDADAAIALATPDDVGSNVGANVHRARARQNVWVEVGWFWGRLGRNRVLLLVRGNVEIPSDLDGIEYHIYKKSPLEREVEIRAFLSQVSRRIQ